MVQDQTSLRPYYNPSTFNSPLKLREPSFSTYSGATIAASSSSLPSHSLNSTSNAGTSFLGSGSKAIARRVATAGGGSGNGSASSAGAVNGGTGPVDFDMDFGTAGDTVAEIGRSMARLYGKIFFSQPWRVGRLLLQVGDWGEEEGVFDEYLLMSGGGLRNQDDHDQHADDEEEEDEDGYDRFEQVHRRKQLDEFGGDADIPHNSSSRGTSSNRRHYDSLDDQYAIRSSSSLSFRGGNGRREIEDLSAEMEGSEEEDDEMSYFTNVAGDLSTRNIRTKSPSKQRQQAPPPRKTFSRTQSVMENRGRPSSRLSRSQSHAGVYGTSRKNSLIGSKKGKEVKRSDDGYDDEDDEYINRIRPESIRFVDIIGALQAQDGLKGLWRGVNTSFILDAMQVTLEAWLSGFFSSISGVPDPHFLDISHSPTPGASLATAVTASVVTAVLLAPLSIIRTRLVATTFETAPRSVRTSVQELPSLSCPSAVLVPTVLYAGAKSTLRKSTSYVLQHIFGVDAVGTPVWYSVLTLLSSVFEVGVRLPLETLVRRSHIAYLSLPGYSLLVRPVGYDGVFGTLWGVLSGRTGVETLYRGWRVSMLGVVSEWGVETLDRSDREKERF